MDFRKLHDLNVSASEAIRIQERLRQAIRIEPYTGALQTIAGADISFNLRSPTAYAAFVVLDAGTLEVIDASEAVVELAFPYVPGLLSFREIPALLEAWKKLKTAPDVVVMDGQGIAHPRRMGIASHMGLFIDRPTIGCGKSRLVGRYAEPGPKPGDRSPLLDRGEVIGEALRTKARTNPVFVSPGHRMDIESATRILLSVTRGYRIPEPTRQAHLWVNRVRLKARAA